MPGVNSLKKLYLASTLGELQEKAKVPKSTPMGLAKVSKTVYENAITAEESGDEEKAYLLFSKYVNLAKEIRTSPDYKKDKMYYDGMVSLKSVKEAIDRLEALTSNLQTRYDEKNKTKNDLVITGRKTPLKEIKPHFNGVQKVEENGKANEENGKVDFVVEPTRLYSIINEKATSFLLLDARPSNDYKISHIKHHASINVPEENLIKGITAKSIER